MALPQDGQNANGLTKVTEVPTGKELIFVDPTTNEGGIITLEDLTTQILNKLTSKIFTLDQGNITLIEALNKLNSNPVTGILNHVYEVTNSKTISVDVSKITSDGNAVPFMVMLCDWSTGKCEMIFGSYRGNDEKQIPKVYNDKSTATCDGKTLIVTFQTQPSYSKMFY